MIQPNAERNVYPSGLIAAFSSAFFLGLAPVFGRSAILLGLPPMAVVAMRTLLAALLLLVVLAVFYRRSLYIYPAGLLGCLLAGGINGIGSLFFYASLARIDASLGQMLNSTYPVFVAFWLLWAGIKPSRLTVFRLALSLVAIYLLTQAPHAPPDPIGMAMMLTAAACYALHLPINQRVLYDMPAQTVTLYTLLAMSAIVVPWFLIFEKQPLSILVNSNPNAWLSVAGLTIATFLSRLTLFLGVKKIGGMQTAIIGLGELLVTLSIAYFWLGERLSAAQWSGALLLILSLGLVGLENGRSKVK